MEVLIHPKLSHLFEQCQRRTEKITCTERVISEEVISVSMTMRFKALVCGLLIAGIVGSKSAEGMYVPLLRVTS